MISKWNKYVKQTIWRGEGGGGDATTDSEINFITSLTNSIVADTALTTANAAASAASALAAATSESNAAASEIAAASSASAASASAISADASANSAANSYDSFDDRYLGSKTVAPTLDNDGNALLVGALYWNSVTTKLFVWSGTAWRDGFFTGLSSSLVTATAGQTVVTTPTYVVGTNTIQVYVNGLKVILGTDFIETSTTSITFSSGLTLGDEVEIVVVQSLTIGTAAASNVSYTPTGTIAAANVQDALSELSSEKVQSTVLAASGGSSLVGYLPSGTGAVAATVQSKLWESVSVKDFGAVGDGVTDDTTAIQSAINSVNLAGGGIILFQAGTYLISATVLLKNNCTLQGSGIKTTTIKLANNSNVNIFEASGGQNDGVCIYDMTINGNQVNNTAGGVYLVGASPSRGPCYQIERIRFTNIRTAIYGGGNRGAVTVAGSGWSVMKDCDFINNDYAQIALLWSATDSQVSGIYIGQNGFSYGGTSYGMWVTTAGVFFTNCYFGGTQNGPQVRLFDASSNKFTSCIFDNAGSNNIEITGTSVDNSFIGGQITYSSYSNGGTYYAFINSVNNSRTLLSGVKFGNYLTVGLPTYAYYEPSGINGASQLIGCEFFGTWATSAVSVPAASTTQFVGCKNYDITTVGTLKASTKLDVIGAYPSSPPSTSSVPLGRFNGGGAISLWAGTYAYSYSWLQSIQDDGTNNFKQLQLNPLGGGVVIGGNLFPTTDNTLTLGSASNRWSVVYAGTGTINTSDEREKQNISDLEIAEKRVAFALKGLIKKFRFKDAVEDKDSGARIHIGVIAQEVIVAFQAEGLDPMRYAIVCYDEWEATDEKPAGNRYGVRYEELLAFIISAL